jgi:hypothetical protein
MFTGESRIFDVPPGIWGYEAQDQWNQRLGAWNNDAQFDPGSDVYFYVCG